MAARQLEVGLRVEVNDVGGGKNTAFDLGKSRRGLFKLEGGSSNVPLDSAQSLGPSTRNVGKRGKREPNRGRLGPAWVPVYVLPTLGGLRTKGRVEERVADREGSVFLGPRVLA